MAKKSKDKGRRWERDAVNELNKAFPETWKRIPGSGAIGTLVGEPLLSADMVGRYSFLDMPVMGEAKVGYGGKSMTVQKDWFDHIQKVADDAFGIPVVVLKFERTVKGVKHVMAMSFETWNRLMKTIEIQDEAITNLMEKLDEPRA